MTFEDATILTRTVSSHTAFEDEECKAYFDILMSLPTNSRIVEIGLEYGRSSTIALQVAKYKGLEYVGIDPFFEHQDIMHSWCEMAMNANWNARLIALRSGDVHLPGPTRCLLIDGDHSAEAVRDDCEQWMPRIPNGGYALFHDYKRASMPEVTYAVQSYFAGRLEWTELPTVGTLGVWRRQ